MKEYKIGEIFQWEDRTLMCVEGKYCDYCYFLNEKCSNLHCNPTERTDNENTYFTNKLIFSAEGLTLQIKRKGCKVKVKVLEMSEEFNPFGIDYEFHISKCYNYTTIHTNSLAVGDVGDKVKYIFPTEQEAIDWVEALFSLRGE